MVCRATSVWYSFGLGAPGANFLKHLDLNPEELQ
jgi:hypothetical protein